MRRAILPMVEAARRLPWHVDIATPATGLGHALNLLLDWCDLPGRRLALAGAGRALVLRRAADG